MNTQQPNLSQMTLLTKAKVLIFASLLLFIGFMTGFFILALAAIMLPFAAIKLWLIQKQFKENIEVQESGQSSQSQTRPQRDSKSEVIEGEYSVEENK